MQVCRPRPIKVKDLDAPIQLHAIGDIHVGEAGCAQRMAEERIAAAASDPSSIVILMGDLGGFIARNDRRWDPQAVARSLTIRDLDDWGQAVVGRVLELLRPVAHKTIGSIEGNHERTFRLQGHGYVARWIADGLGCPLLGYSGLGQLVFECGKHRRTLDFYATHGAGCAITIGAKMNRLKRAMNDFPFVDLTLYAHVHVSQEYMLPRLQLKGGRLTEHLQTGVITGSYLRTYSEGHSSYGEVGGYAPASLGHRIVEIVPGRGVVGSRQA